MSDGHEIAPVTVRCEACGSEGRILVDRTGRWDLEPRIEDDGPCDVCEGTGLEVIEDVEPVTLEDLP